ncbi:GNAT family N-acetyltransferase [Streptomyces sp. NPDC059118]|uniref:GNAT family N-acetyltransferase n=1 Tax=unclassified Streptomyces TaxID=2593676 RepID=UPI0036CACECC
MSRRGLPTSIQSPPGPGPASPASSSPSATAEQRIEEPAASTTTARSTGHRRPAAAGKVDLGYLFLPRAWGSGYAAEACAAALGWLAGELPGEPVVLTTQTANIGSKRLAGKLGFTEVERFEAWGAEQWLGMRSPLTPPD